MVPISRALARAIASPIGVGPAERVSAVSVSDSVSPSVVVSTTVGAVAAYYGGIIDAIFMRIADVMTMREPATRQPRLAGTRVFGSSQLPQVEST